eukprot:Plantae.Rhodophyta-Palmaria_palmata.ctg1055.p3 GENE.Plantae.Rhodophyta-Palmaria_palmata.ctg1055~~Plantae.Rhodophyta-Palmaria_palmata.ctg1055.p3  ORF type:complete len:100 (-),score=21.47 Plantae.Rhodophyta-Palmaria_palmata.ctg1055:400-699(-)
MVVHNYEKFKPGGNQMLSTSRTDVQEHGNNEQSGVDVDSAKKDSFSTTAALGSSFKTVTASVERTRTPAFTRNAASVLDCSPDRRGGRGRKAGKVHYIK